MKRSPYKQLDPKKIIETAERLNNRILERLPDSGLGEIAHEVHSVTRTAADRSLELAKPYIGLRIGSFIFALLFIFFVIYLLAKVNFGPIATSLSDLIQALDAAIEATIFCGGGMLFLLTLETRLKRRRALNALHELRSLAHLIDMHQLTKDPERALHRGEPTASSPKDTMDSFLLSRYLDYCSEMLSIISKVAALYVQHLPDPVVLDAVDALESLTNGLARKIWQKIMILDRMA